MAEATYSMTQVTDVPATTSELVAWLEAKAKAHGLRWLLAHSDDGVNWGEFDEEGLTTSHDVAVGRDYVPQLLLETLQQLRLFGDTAELLLWPTSDGPAGRLIEDGTGKDALDPIDEPHLLWGLWTEEPLTDGFMVVRENDGLRHVVPWSDDATRPGPQDKPKRRLHLTVRHYVAYDDDGQAYVRASRLVDLGSHVRKGGSK